MSRHCGSRPFYSKEEKKLAADAMEKMQITPLAKRCYRTLSGGQQQRVLLSRACAPRKKCCFWMNRSPALIPR